MGLRGILSAKTEIKCHGNVFHDLFRHKPHHVSQFVPDKVQGCELHEGEYGKVGSVLSWKYTHEGKEKVLKTMVESIDEEKKIFKFKAIEGDVLEHYKNYSFTMHIETQKSHSGHEDDEEHLVTWSIEYEKKSENSPPPTSYLDFALGVTKDIEDQHAKKEIKFDFEKKEIEGHHGKKEFEAHFEKEKIETHHGKKEVEYEKKGIDFLRVKK